MAGKRENFDGNVLSEDEAAAYRTPPAGKRVRLEQAAPLMGAGGNSPPALPDDEEELSQGVVTPAVHTLALPYDEYDWGTTAESPEPRKALFSGNGNGQAPRVTPAKVPLERADPTAKRKLMFGRLVDVMHVQKNVRQVYSIVKKLTGSIGGNGSHGPIYGELTMNSMQKLINLMKEHTGFDYNSRFIDVGSGIGKPNLHVAHDPGVEFSYGIEIEQDRYLLGMTCLKGLLAAVEEQSATVVEVGSRLSHRVVFEHGDIRRAKTFDRFTHVYMFSIGFPPALWIDLSEMWNQSKSEYLICFHGPKDIIRSYEFNVELVTQTSTSMHGSKEGHMGYIYQRTPEATPSNGGVVSEQACDPAFDKAEKLVSEGFEALKTHVQQTVERMTPEGPSTRSRRKRAPTEA